MAIDNCAPNCFPLHPIQLHFAHYSYKYFHGDMLWPTLVVIDTMGRMGWDAMGGVVT